MESIGMSTSTARHAQNACTTTEREDLALCNSHRPPELVNAGTATRSTWRKASLSSSLEKPYLASQKPGFSTIAARTSLPSRLPSSYTKMSFVARE
jgi:hypothetical protein